MIYLSYLQPPQGYLLPQLGFGRWLTGVLRAVVCETLCAGLCSCGPSVVGRIGGDAFLHGDSETSWESWGGTGWIGGQRGDIDIQYCAIHCTVYITYHLSYIIISYALYHMLHYYMSLYTMWYIFYCLLYIHCNDICTLSFSLLITI